MVLGLCMMMLLTGCSTSYLNKLKDVCTKQGYDAGKTYFNSIKGKASIDENLEMLEYLKGFLVAENPYLALDSPSYSSSKTDYTSDLSVETLDYDYKDDKIKLTVKNNSDKTITYFKYDIFMKNDKGDIIDSDWSNSSKTILPDAQAMVESYVEMPTGTTNYSVKITEVKVE